MATLGLALAVLAIVGLAPQGNTAATQYVLAHNQIWDIVDVKIVKVLPENSAEAKVKTSNDHPGTILREPVAISPTVTKAPEKHDASELPESPKRSNWAERCGHCRGSPQEEVPLSPALLLPYNKPIVFWPIKCRVGFEAGLHLTAKVLSGLTQKTLFFCVVLA